MKTTKTQRRPFWAALAVIASLFLALLITAPGVQANIGAGARIMNTVTVNYRDAGGTASYSAAAATYTSVDLVKAGLTISGRPTSGASGDTASCPTPSAQTVDSGETASYLIALTATANGGETYKLAANLGTVTNMASQTVTWATMRNDGTSEIDTENPGTVNLGASVVQAVNVGAGTISIPGGSQLAAAIQTNTAGYKVVVIHGIDYIVDSISWGSAPTHTNNDGTTYYNVEGTKTNESLAVLTLGANTGGSGIAPSTGLSNVVVGDVVAEQILVRINVTGVVGGAVATDGVVNFQLSTTDNSDGNPVDSCNIQTTFRGMNLGVLKRVRNCGPDGTTCGSFAASATGDPLDILEYEVQVKNNGGSVAKLVTGLDAVPTYTQLVCGVGALGTTVCTGTVTDIIATISDGATPTPNIINITYQATDDECNDYSTDNVGAGDAAGFAEGSALHFYLGNTCDGNSPGGILLGTGGNVTSTQTYTITYRVKMN